MVESGSSVESTLATGRKGPGHRAGLWAQALVIALVLLYVVYFSVYSIQRHRAFQSGGFDLGNVDQAVWNTLHGRVLRMTNEEGTENRLGTHFDPILALLSPLYLVYSSPEILLIVQTLALALVAVPVFCLASESLSSPWAGMAFAAAFLLMPAVQAANLHDFHAVALGASFLAWAFYFLHRDEYRLFGLFSILAMTCKENLPLIVFMMGLYIVIIKRRVWLGLLTMVVSAAWFLVAVQVVIPHFNQFGSSQLHRFGYLGESPGAILSNAVRNPGLVLDNFRNPLKVSYLVRLTFPLGFLSLLAPQVLILSAPVAAINFLSTHYPMYALDRWHGSISIAPFVVFAAAWGAGMLVRWLHRWRGLNRGFLTAVLVAYVLIFTTIYHLRFGYTPFVDRFAWPTVTDHDRLGQELAESLPPGSLVAQDSLNAHVSQRETIYVFPYGLDRAEMVFMDVSTLPIGGHDTPEENRSVARSLLTGDEFGLLQSKDGYLVLQRGAPMAPATSEFYNFLRVDDVGDARPVAADLGALRLVGLKIIEGQAMTLEVHSYWQVLGHVEDDPHLFIGLFEEGVSPQPIMITESMVTYWYPPSDWAAGQIIHDWAFLPLPAHVDSAAMSLGFFAGPEEAVSRAGPRSPISILDSGGLSLRADEGILLTPAWSK